MYSCRCTRMISACYTMHHPSGQQVPCVSGSVRVCSSSLPLKPYFHLLYFSPGLVGQRNLKCAFVLGGTYFRQFPSLMNLHQLSVLPFSIFSSLWLGIVSLLFFSQIISMVFDNYPNTVFFFTFVTGRTVI